MSSRTIDINMDMGESYGRWRLGDEEGAMPWVTSANIACGFHAGDPATMRASARLAIEHGVGIGAHVGFPDLLGFGRRRIDVTPDEVRDYTAYQIGALDAIVRSEGGRLAHVKPHGALYGLCSFSAKHAVRGGARDRSPRRRLAAAPVRPRDRAGDPSTRRPARCRSV